MAKIKYKELDHDVDCEYCGEKTNEIVNYHGDKICRECAIENYKEDNMPDDPEGDYWDRRIDERRGK